MTLSTIQTGEVDRNPAEVGRPPETSATSPLVYARIAGLLYLVIFVCGIFSEVFVRARLVVDADPAATADNIVTSAGLFRLGFASDLVMVVADGALAVVLFLLLTPVSVGLSLAAAAFRLVQAAILGLNLLHHFMALQVLDGGSAYDSFDLPGYDGGLSGIVLAPAVIAELATIGWLLVKGVDVPRWQWAQAHHDRSDRRATR
jgi:hypothetical protein